MEDLNNVPSSGTYGAAINEVNANFSLIVNAINSLEYATTHSKGIYNNGFTPNTTTLPNSVDGDWCMVLGTGNTFPARIWTFNGTTWAQGGTWNPDGINLNDYATTSALNTAVANSLLQATARMGYGEATASNNAYSVSIANYTLPTNGGVIRVKMPTSATGAATLNISETGAKTIWYNGLAVTSENTWGAGEVISVFYDGTQYQATLAQGGIYPRLQDNFESDFDIADKRNYVIVRFENGHLRTKNFNSATTPKIESLDDSDFSISDGNGHAIAMFKNGHIKTKNFDSKDLINYVQYSELNGKRVVFVGDSFTQGNELPDSSKVYCNVFAEVSGCTIVNLGVAGSSIAKRANNAARFYTRCTASNLAGADLIIVQGGTNDFDLDSKAIGDLFDYVDTTPVDYFGGKTIVAPSDTEAFGGAMHQLIQTIRTNAPRVPIVFVTPTNRGTYGHSRLPTSYEYNKNMNTMQEYRDAMERICEFYQIPVFKAHLIPQLDFTNEAVSLAYSVGDNLHPNAAGNDVLGKALYKFIMNNITLN